MKKFTSLFFVAAMALSAYAGSPSYQITSPQESGIPSFREIRKQNADSKMSVAPMKVSDGIITEVPDGKSQIYAIESYSFYVAMGSYVGFEYVTMARKAILTDDAIYLDGLGSYYKDTYIKAAKKDDTTYVISLPCPIYSQDYMDWETQEMITVNYELRLMDGVRDEEGTITGYTPTDETEVELTYKDGVISLNLGYEPGTTDQADLPTPEKILGVCVDNGNWAGYGDAGFKWTPFEGEVATPPSDMKIENWVLGSEDKGTMIRMGFSGDEVWIGDLQPNHIPDAWVKGTIKGDKVVIESGQYLGIIWEEFVYFVSALVDATGYSEVEDFYEFDYDPVAKTIKANDPDMIIAISARPNSVIRWVSWTDPTFTYQPEEIDLTPQLPFNLRYDDWFEYYDYATFSFDESNMNVNGQLLDTSTMYYRFYFDGDLVVFGADDYEGYDDFSEPTSDIPFNLNSSHFWTWDITHQCMITLQGLSTIGVQVVNIVDNETYTSPIATLDIASGDVTVGVDSIVNNSEVSGIEYYDMNGMKIQNPGKGLFICKTVMTDGSTKTRKIMRK